MSLKTWVDEECTSSWIHRCNKLGVVDILQSQLVLIIPMLVVSVLSQQCNGSLGIVWIWTWHVQIINEVDQLLGGRWCIQFTCFLLKLLLKNQLKQVGCGVEVEIDNLLDINTVRGIAKLIEHTFDDLSLTETSKSCKHW
jgi:hypothetical protein